MATGQSARKPAKRVGKRARVEEDTQQPVAAPSDGRRARTHKNRQAVIEALLALLREGVVSPSTAQVAARAGVTPRTLFNLFGDVSGLLVAVGEYQLAFTRARLPSMAAVIDGAHQNVDHEARIASYVSELASFLEAQAPVRWAALSYPDASAQIAHSVTRIRKLMNERVAELLLPCGIELGHDRELAQALELVLDPLSFRLLRVQQGLSLARARSVLVRSVLALVRDAQQRARTMPPSAAC